MTLVEITKENVFEYDPDFEVPPIAEEYIDGLETEEVAVALAGAAKLWEILTLEQKQALTVYQRSALERLHEGADECCLTDEFGKELNEWIVKA